MPQGSSYIFFEADLRDRFLEDLRARGVESSAREDAMEGYVVELTHEPDDDVLDDIENTYEALMQEQMLRAESRPDWGSHQVASLQVALSGGQVVEVRLPPDVARTLLANHTVEEARELVQAIAQSLEHPQDGPLCRRDLLKIQRDA